MNIDKQKQARILVCQCQELIDDDMPEEVKNLSPELKIRFDQTTMALRNLYRQISLEIEWSSNDE